MPQSDAALPALSGVRKAAMFLMGVGDQIGADVLRHLEFDEIRRITWEISALESVAPAHMVSVFREFEALASSSQFFANSSCTPKLYC